MATPTTTMAGTTALSGAWCNSERSTAWASATACTTTATRAQGADGQCDAGDPPQTGNPGRELRVDQARPAGARADGAYRLNVVSFTSTGRPISPSLTARRAVPASSQVAAVRTPSARSATMAVRTGSRPAVPP